MVLPVQWSGVRAAVEAMDGGRTMGVGVAFGGALMRLARSGNARQFNLQGDRMTSHRSVRSRLATLMRTCVLAALFVGVLGGASIALARPTFDPTTVLSDDNMRDYNSMSAAQIQAFLNSKSGLLKNRSFARHDGGSVAPASVIIWEACQAWHINPKVMLTMLQKEQSLLTRRTLSSQTLNRAIGAGCPNRTDNRYPGFGNQMWNGARMLDGYGEEGKTTEYVKHPWTVGMTNGWTGGNRTNTLATYKLYVYNPSLGAKLPYGDLSRHKSLSGNANFWRLYWGYFGDPLSVKPAPVASAEATTSVYLNSQYARRRYDQSAQLSGSLISSAAVAGAAVHLEAPNGSGWADVAGSTRALDASGSFAYTLQSTSVQRLRVAFGGGAGLKPSASGCFVSDAASVLTTPVVAASVSARRAARISGAVAPAHRTKVSVSLYRSAKGKWRRWKTVSVKSSASGAWVLKVKLPKGSWRIIASHNDAGHAAGTSATASTRSK